MSCETTKIDHRKTREINIKIYKKNIETKHGNSKGIKTLSSGIIIVVLKGCQWFENIKVLTFRPLTASFISRITGYANVF